MSSSHLFLVALLLILLVTLVTAVEDEANSRLRTAAKHVLGANLYLDVSKLMGANVGGFLSARGASSTTQRPLTPAEAEAAAVSQQKTDALIPYLTTEFGDESGRLDDKDTKAVNVFLEALLTSGLDNVEEDLAKLKRDSPFVHSACITLVENLDASMKSLQTAEAKEFISSTLLPKLKATILDENLRKEVAGDFHSLSLEAQDDLKNSFENIFYMIYALDEIRKRREEEDKNRLKEATALLSI